MRYVDAFNHFFPQRFFDELVETPGGQKDLGKRVRGIPALYDLDERFRVVESFPDYAQVLSLGMPAIDRLWEPDRAAEMARIGDQRPECPDDHVLGRPHRQNRRYERGLQTPHDRLRVLRAGFQRKERRIRHRSIDARRFAATDRLHGHDSSGLLLWCDSR